MGLLDGKTCIVTGAAGSLGLASAARLLEEGGRVMLVDLKEAALAAAARTLAAHGERVAFRAADVADAAQTRAYIEETVARWGRIDVLFSNAGISGGIAPISDYPDEQFDAVMAVNVRGSFLACKHGMGHMNDGGSIIFTASVAGVTADPGVCAYITSKHALIGLMRVTAKEGAPRNIRANAIAPGPIDNDFQLDIEKRLTPVVGRDGTEFLNERIPLGRHGTAAEIAEAVLFLASDRSSFTTGTVLMADGGMHI